MKLDASVFMVAFGLLGGLAVASEDIGRRNGALDQNGKASMPPFPVVVSAHANEARSYERRFIDLTFEVQSKLPVIRCYANFQVGPSGYISAARHPLIRRIRQNLYECKLRYPISDWTPSGTYWFSGIHAGVKNVSIGLYYDKHVSISIQSKKAHIEPSISAVNVLQEGNDIRFEIKVKSDAPIVDGVRMYWSGPNACMGGGDLKLSSTYERSVSGQYIVKARYRLPAWAPTGKYSFGGFSVGNEAFQAARYDQQIQVNFIGSDAEMDPVVASIDVSPSTVPATGGWVRLSAKVHSEAPLVGGVSQFSIQDPSGGRVPLGGLVKAPRKAANLAPGKVYELEATYILGPGDSDGDYFVSVDVMDGRCKTNLSSGQNLGRITKLAGVVYGKSVADGGDAKAVAVDSMGTAPAQTSGTGTSRDTRHAH